MATNDKSQEIIELFNQGGADIDAKVSGLLYLLDQNKIENMPIDIRRLIGKVLREIYDQKPEAFFDLLPRIDLTYDSGNYTHNAPREIFDLLREYLGESTDSVDKFKDRFKQLSNIFLTQYQESDRYDDRDTGENKFDGFEWAGGGMSATNDSYSVSENHFVRHVLRPALNEYHDKKPERAYEFVKGDCIHRNENDEIEIDRENPDFLLRSCVDVILREYTNGENSEEAFLILKEFMGPIRGLPNKPSLIFESVWNEYVELSDEKKHKLVKAQLEIDRFDDNPANVFVEKIIAELAKRGNGDARQKLKELIGKEDYLNRGMFDGDRIPSRIEDILDDDPSLSFELAKAYLETNAFKNNTDTFFASKMGGVMQQMFAHNSLKDDTLDLLKELAQKKQLTDSEQVALTRSLCDPADNDPDKEHLLFVFNGFLKPFLTSLDDDLKRDYDSQEYGKIYEKLPLNLARQNIVEFATKLADAKRVDEAMHIVRIFVNDPHPFEGCKDEVSEENRNNMHQKMQEGDDAMVISTVRGRCGWTLRKCVTPEAQKHIQDIIGFTKKLLEDENYYAQAQAIMALGMLTRNRLKFMPDSDELFFAVENNKKEALERSKKVENIAFGTLDCVISHDSQLQKSFAKPLAYMLVHLRELNQEESDRFLGKLKEANDEVVVECVAIFLYFAELREDNFSDWGQNRQADGLYDDLDEYDPGHARELMQALFQRSDHIKREFSNRFTHLPENISDTQKGAQIAYKYFPQIIGIYDRQIFHNLYRFLEDNLTENSDTAAELFMKALEAEKDHYSNLEGDSVSGRYRSLYHHMGKVLKAFYNNGQEEVFLEAVKVISQFPEDVYVNLSGVSDILTEEIDTAKSKQIAKKLELLNP